MKQAKQNKLEKKGWTIGSTADFLGLTSEESAYIDLKIALGDFLHSRRKKQHLTQVALAEKLSSSQSRVAKMEKADPSVSVDLLMRSLYALGTENAEIASVIAEATPEYSAEPEKKKRKKSKV
jgi:hypothetical protein